MLKHMLNGSQSSGTGAGTGTGTGTAAAGEPSGGALSSAAAAAAAVVLRRTRSSSPNGAACDPPSATQQRPPQLPHLSAAARPQPQQQQQQQQQQAQPPLPPSPPPPQRQLRPPFDDDSAGHARRPAAFEPEYQNTRRRSSPTCDFWRSVPPARCVRSAETAEPEARSRRPAPDAAAWMASSTHGRPSAPARDTGAATVGGAFPFVASPQHHASSLPLPPPPPPPPPPPLPHHSLNQSDSTTFNVSAMAAIRLPFTPVANGPTKPMANGGLHIVKRSPTIGAAAYASREGGPLRSASAEDADVDEAEAEAEGDDAYGDCGRENGVKEMLTSLGLLCLISLLLALLSLIFLLRISPVAGAADLKDSTTRADHSTLVSPDEYVTVYEVTLALCALTLSLNLCCLLVCSVQFLFAVKLTRSSPNGDRTNNYLRKSAVTRVCAVAGFFVSIPVFLTGVILYTFVQFHSTAAIVTSVLVGCGIVFCGCAMVHNVFVWQKEKTNAVKELVRRRRTAGQRAPRPRIRRAEEAAAAEKPDAVPGADHASAASAGSPAYALGRAAAVDGGGRGGNVSRASHELSTLV